MLGQDSLYSRFIGFALGVPIKVAIVLVALVVAMTTAHQKATLPNWRACVGSQFGGPVHQGGEVVVVRLWGHLQSGRRERRTLVLSSLSPFLFSLGPQPLVTPPVFRMGLPSSVNSLETPRGLSFRWHHQLDNEHDPSYSSDSWMCNSRLCCLMSQGRDWCVRCGCGNIFHPESPEYSIHFQNIISLI